MENKPSNLRESLWRRKLSDAERAGLRAQPELELEARLTDALAKIPDAPVPSNFTARVLAAVELEENQASPFARLDVELAGMVAARGGGRRRFDFCRREHPALRSRIPQRVALAKNIAMVAAAQPPPSVDALENLDAIQRMSQSGHADGELLAALQ